MTSPLNLTLISSTTSLFLALTGCRGSLSPSDSPLDSVVSAEKTAAYDRDWCAKNQVFKPGHCFTLILRIPKPTMIKDLGLSIMSLAEDSTKLNPTLHEACTSGIVQYYLNYTQLSVIPRPLLQGLAWKINYGRCIILPFGTEDEAMQPVPLHPKEMAIDVRLTKFEISQLTENWNANMLHVSGQSVVVQTGYRSAAIASGSDGHGSYKAGERLNLPSLGLHPRMTSSKFTQDLAFSVNLNTLRKNFESVVTVDSQEATASVKSFLDKAKSAVLAQDPVGGTLLLLGMGFRAIGTLCGISKTSGIDQELCGYVQKSGIKTQEIASQIELPSSDNNEMLRSAIIYSIESLMVDVMTKGDSKQIKDVYGI